MGLISRVSSRTYRWRIGLPQERGMRMNELIDLVKKYISIITSKKYTTKIEALEDAVDYLSKSDIPTIQQLEPIDYSETVPAIIDCPVETHQKCVQTDCPILSTQFNTPYHLPLIRSTEVETQCAPKVQTTTCQTEERYYKPCSRPSSTSSLYFQRKRNQSNNNPIKPKQIRKLQADELRNLKTPSNTETSDQDEDVEVDVISETSSFKEFPYKSRPVTPSFKNVCHEPPVENSFNTEVINITMDDDWTSDDQSEVDIENTDLDEK